MSFLKVMLIIKERERESDPYSKQKTAHNALQLTDRAERDIHHLLKHHSAHTAGPLLNATSAGPLPSLEGFERHHGKRRK